MPFHWLPALSPLRYHGIDHDELPGNMVALPWDFLPVDARQADAKEAFALYRRAVFSGMGEAQSALGRLQTNRNRLAALETQMGIERRPSHYLMRDSEWVSAIFCALLTHNAS